MISPDKRLTRILKALANEHRLSLYLQIWQQQRMAVPRSECFVSDLAAKMKIGAPTISHHIKELESAGLITTQKVGKQITASADPETHSFVLTQLGG
ncbi:ArsR/SmtB family transcription factor [Hymenobacter terrenus]|uniref:ArsR/SmtB family transcription factor n=1 Tax=Hymenobacter terrenus TaxID=1629124 RepID=UPI00061985E5|nr:metalloregulator ArsR/SmtB family transcription factor [Hymenobacter terrenus]